MILLQSPPPILFFDRLRTILPTGTPQNVVLTIVAFVALWIVRRLVIQSVGRWVDDPSVVYNWRRSSDYIALAIGLVVVWNIWFSGDSNGSFTTYLGLLSAGIAIALQDILVNFIGWVFLVTRRPFEVGDRIEVGDHTGDVIDIRFFQFVMLEVGDWVHAEQSTGRVLNIPNRFVFSEATASYSRGFSYIWNEIPVEITFESDWRKAKELMFEIAERHALRLTDADKQRIRSASLKHNISYGNVTPIVYTSVAASGIVLTLRLLCRPRQRRIVTQGVWEDVLDAIAENPDIDLAYPTQRVYYHPAEGKTLTEEPHVTIESTQAVPPFKG